MQWFTAFGNSCLLYSFRFIASLPVSLDGWNHHVFTHCFLFALARLVARSALVYRFELLLVTGRHSAAQHSVLCPCANIASSFCFLSIPGVLRLVSDSSSIIGTRMTVVITYGVTREVHRGLETLLRPIRIRGGTREKLNIEPKWLQSLFRQVFEKKYK